MRRTPATLAALRASSVRIPIPAVALALSARAVVLQTSPALPAAVDAAWESSCQLVAYTSLAANALLDTSRMPRVRPVVSPAQLVVSRKLMDCQLVPIVSPELPRVMKDPLHAHLAIQGEDKQNMMSASRLQKSAPFAPTDSSSLVFLCV
jgi:hypothetical protein